jgi:hypothetical protein
VPILLPDHPLYRRTDRVLVTPATPERGAYTFAKKTNLCGWYPVSALSAANKGPGVRNGNAGIPLLGPGSFTWVGLNYELLTQIPPAGAVLMQAGAGMPLFGSSGAGTPLLGSGAGTPLLGSGAGTPLLGSGAGTPLLGGGTSAIPLVGPGSEAALALAPKTQSNFYVHLCAEFDVPTVAPAVSGTPAVYKDASTPGWDAGAVSTMSFAGNGRVSFRVGLGGRNIVGMLEGTDPLISKTQFFGFIFGVNTDFSTSMRFYDSPSLLSISAGGTSLRHAGDRAVMRLGAVSNVGQTVIGYDENTVFSIERVKNTITYKVDGKVFSQDTFAAGVLPPAVMGLAAAMYWPGTMVSGLEVYGFTVGDGTLPTLAGRAGSGAAKSGATAWLPAMQFFSHAASRANAVLAPLKSRGGRPLAEGYTSMPQMVASGVGGFGVYGANYAATALPAMISVGGRDTAGGSTRLPRLATTSRVAVRSAAALPALAALGGRKTAQAHSSTPALKARGFQGIVGPNRSAGKMPAATTRGRSTVGTVGRAISSLPALLTRSTGTSNLRLSAYSTVKLPHLLSLGGRRTGQGAPALPALTTKSRSAVRVVGVLPALQINAGKRTGKSSAAMRALTTQGGGRQVVPAPGARRGAGAGTLPGMLAYGLALVYDEAAFYSSAFTFDGLFPAVEIIVVMNSAGVVSQVFGIAMTRDATMASAALSTTPLTLSSILAAVMGTEVSAGSDVPLYEQAGEVWAVSLAEDAATSTFEDYPFNSFGTIGGRAFGAKQDGVFRLEGDTDGGAPIRSSVSYGKQDFGTKTEKHMTRAYVGASSTGALYLKVIAGGVEHVYAARSSSAELAQQRFDVGRGIKGNYFTFELFNKNGGDFEIDSVSFFAAEFKRRI